MGRYDSLVEQIKTIKTEEVKSWDSNTNPVMNVVEQQKVYIWIRLYLKNELSDIQVGDDFRIEYTPTGEYMDIKFICYDKTSLTKDHDDMEKVINFNPEDDKKVLCFMVDIELLKSESIPFIKTLFKNTPYYQEQLFRKSELTFTNLRNSTNVEYFDCVF